MQNIVLRLLASADFSETALKNAIQIGARQYVTVDAKRAFPEPAVCEGLLKSKIILSEEGRVSKLEIPRFAKVISFFDFMDKSYTMPKEKFRGFLSAVSRLFVEGSTMVFARPGNESFHELEKLMSSFGFLIYEHIGEEEINSRFLSKYNSADINFSLHNINFYLAVKKETNPS
ncbi:MAG: hypothetical protein IJO61_02080 [Oscillospiraceae bacterium]|nr:hypothetical protein [Oscillospiraceae bacterium]